MGRLDELRINAYLSEVARGYRNNAFVAENLFPTIYSEKEKVDIFYDERPVWIQEVSNNIAKVGFVDNFEEKDVFVEDLYEKNLYNF